MSNHGESYTPEGVSLPPAKQEDMLREAADPATHPNRLKALVGSFEELELGDDYDGFAREVHRLVFANPNFDADTLLGHLRYSTANLTNQAIEGAMQNPSWPFFLLTDEPRVVATLAHLGEYLRQRQQPDWTRFTGAWSQLMPLHEQLFERMPLHDEDDRGWAEDRLLQPRTMRLHPAEVREAQGMLLSLLHMRTDTATGRWLIGWTMRYFTVLDDESESSSIDRLVRGWMRLVRDELGLVEGERG